MFIRIVLSKDLPKREKCTLLQDHDGNDPKDSSETSLLKFDGILINRATKDCRILQEFHLTGYCARGLENTFGIPLNQDIS